MRESGFTLVEVLIALAVTAFVAAASYTGISAVLSGAEQLRVVGERTRDINRAISLLDRDLRQFIDRPVRDEFGELQPALAGGPLALFSLSLTREGWHNSRGQPRSDLQRVHYFLDDGTLWRSYHLSLDRAVDAQIQEVELLAGVSDLELRFLESIEGLELGQNLVVDTRSWQRNWVALPGVSSTPPPPPVALELRLVLDDVGEIRRLYALPPN